MSSLTLKHWPPIPSFPQGGLESRSTRTSESILANLDAGYPCQHDERLHFSSSVVESGPLRIRIISLL